MARSPVASRTTPPQSDAGEGTLQVYLVPLGPARHELFCERQAEEGAVETDGPARGVWGRLVGRFGVMLRAAEDREANPEAARRDDGWWARVHGRMLAWMAERVAEQRLLWRLRGKTRVVVDHPDDLAFADVHAIAHRLLRADYDRHRRWLVVDAVVLVVSGILAIVPGPNVLAYFFAFRVVGHWLSMRGARHGLHVATWEGRPSSVLARLRGVEQLAAPTRFTRLREVADELGVERLPRFVERMLKRR